MFRFRKKRKLTGVYKPKKRFRVKVFSRRKKEKKLSDKKFILGSRVNFWKRFFVKLGYFLLFVSFCALIFVFFFTSLFIVENITLERENLRVDSGKVIDSLKDYRYRNILLISTSSIENKIQQDFPEYQEVNVKRNFPNTLVIQVKNYEIIAKVKIYVKSQMEMTDFNMDVRNVEMKPYELILVLNSQGIVEQYSDIYESLPLLEIPLVYEKPLVQGDRLVAKKNLDLIWEAKTLINEELGMDSREIKYFEDAKEVHLKIEQGYEIWVDFTTPLSQQIDKLKKISNDVDWSENPPADHIDLRVKNRIIYK